MASYIPASDGYFCVGANADNTTFTSPVIGWKFDDTGALSAITPDSTRNTSIILYPVGTVVNMATGQTWQTVQDWTP